MPFCRLNPETMKKYLLIFAGTYCALAVPLLLLAVYLHKKSSLSLLSIALAGMAAGYFFARQNPDQALEKNQICICLQGGRGGSCHSAVFFDG